MFLLDKQQKWTNMLARDSQKQYSQKAEWFSHLCIYLIQALPVPAHSGDYVEFICVIICMLYATVESARFI